MEIDDSLIKVIKSSIKEFEYSFQKCHNRKPSKCDISKDPKIYKYYKIYWKIKQSTDGDDGSKEQVKLNTSTTVEQNVTSKSSEKISTTFVGRTWSKDLNKNAQSTNAKSSDDKSKFDYTSVTAKIRKLNEEHYKEQVKSNKLLNYSLRYRRQCLLEKSKEVAEQIRQKKAEEEKKQLSAENILNSLTFDKCTTDTSKSTNFTQIASLGSNLLPPSTNIPTENDNEFALDNLNEFIKSSILENDLLKSDKTSGEGANKTNKKRIFDIEDESSFSMSKRFKLNEVDSITKTGDDFVIYSTNNDSNSNVYDFTDDNESTVRGTSNKFFKSRDKNTNYDAHLFFDHHKNLDFDTIEKDCSLLKKVECQQQPEGVKKLANVTNQSDVGKTTKLTEQEIATKKLHKKIKDGNFRRLNMKKKVMSRGYKKFNMKQYKFKSWQKNKKLKKFDNKCFKCNEPGHFANECPNLPSQNVIDHIDNDDSSTFVSEEIVSDQTYNVCLNRSLFTDLDDPELETLVNESLNEFGFKEFRPNQKLTIKRILCGKSTLLISPTGFGKSLCYQIAAHCFWKSKRLITIVISPLISLMQDQIHNFPSCLKPVCFNSSQNEKEKEDAINAIIEGKAQVLFLSPECIVNGLHSINFNAFSRVAFVCIDEAHCLAEWSNNFRPSYLHLYKILYHKLNIRTILAMTATVTRDTLRVICKNLNFDPADDVIGGTKVPDNLVLTVSKENNKLVALIDLLQSEPFKSLKSIIVYCTKREQTEQIQSYIRTALQFEMVGQKIQNLVRAYHAGLTTYERTNIQKSFISGKLRIVVATIAFGMGINKKDIRGIIHFNMPKSFENYIQEIGRAGRDGLVAHCRLFLDNDGEDLFGLQNYIYANGVDKPGLRKLVGKIYQPCKCSLLAHADEDTLSSPSTSSSAQNSPNPICSGHPVALPISQTESEIDIKSESIYTLLMSLELNYPKAAIQVLPPTNSIANLVYFGEEEDIALMVKQNAILQMGATLAKQEFRTLDFSNFKFSVVRVAKMLGMEVNAVKSELKRLEWTVDKNTGRKKRSQVNIRFSDYSYFIRAPGTLLDTEMEEVVDYLHDAIQKYESIEIFKLRYVYSNFSRFITNQEESDSLDTVMDNSDQLKSFINNYFQNESSVTVERDNSSLCLPYTFDIKKQDLASISYTITEFINFYYDHGVNTPRKMARILQGISSPKYPAETWAKVRKYWRSLSKIDFKDLMELCREGLVNNYNIKDV